jgi:amino acid transporter
MRQFVIALIAFFTPFVALWIWRQLRRSEDRSVDARVWFAGCVMAALSFVVAAILDASAPSGRYIETRDAQGRPVTVFQEEPR